MARRWFVRTADNVITGMSDTDTVEVPANHTAVTDATIRSADPPGATGRIKGGGTWDGTTYTAPSGGGILVPFEPDATTELGRKQIALTAHHAQLRAWEYGIIDAGHEKPRIDRNRALQFLAMAHWGSYVVSVMHAADELTIAQLEAWTVASSQGSADVSDVQTYYEKAHTLSDDLIPQEACTWADPATGIAVDMEEIRDEVNAGRYGLLLQWTGNRHHIGLPRQRSMDQGANRIMATPTLGQFITPDTEVDLDERYCDSPACCRWLASCT